MSLVCLTGPFSLPLFYKTSSREHLVIPTITFILYIAEVLGACGIACGDTRPNRPREDVPVHSIYQSYMCTRSSEFTFGRPVCTSGRSKATFMPAELKATMPCLPQRTTWTATESN